MYRKSFVSIFFFSKKKENYTGTVVTMVFLLVKGTIYYKYILKTNSYRSLFTLVELG